MDHTLLFQIETLRIAKFVGAAIWAVGLFFFRQPNVPLWKPFTSWNSDQHFTWCGTWLLCAGVCIYILGCIPGFLEGVRSE